MAEVEVTFDEAVKQASFGMIYQESKAWHHRGVRTEFSDEDRRQTDWTPVISTLAGKRGER